MSALILLILLVSSLFFLMYYIDKEDVIKIVISFGMALFIFIFICIGISNSNDTDEIVNNYQDLKLLAKSVERTDSKHQIIIIEKVIKHNKNLKTLKRFPSRFTVT